MATAECHFGGGLNSSSGGELKFSLKWKRNTQEGVPIQGDLCPGGSLSSGGLCQGDPQRETPIW